MYEDLTDEQKVGVKKLLKDFHDDIENNPIDWDNKKPNRKTRNRNASRTKLKTLPAYMRCDYRKVGRPSRHFFDTPNGDDFLKAHGEAYCEVFLGAYDKSKSKSQWKKVRWGIKIANIAKAKLRKPKKKAISVEEGKEQDNWDVNLNEK